MQKLKLLFIALLFSATANAQTANKEQSTIQQTIENMFAALTNADTAALKTFVPTNVHFYEYGQVWTIDTLIQKIMLASKATDYKRSNIFDFVNTTINGNTAWATYYLQSEITRNGKQELVKWMETVVLVKLKNQWKIKLLHSTLIKRT